MKKVRKILTWYYILIKRLFKKPGFLMILLLIPILSICLNLAAKEEKSMISVAVASYDKSPYAHDIVKAATKKSDLISYVVCDEPEDAIELVKRQEIDTAWILKDEIELAVDNFAAGKVNALADVYIVEDNTFIQSSREVLFGALFEKISYRMYERAVELTIGTDVAPDEVIKEEYNIFGQEDSVVEMKFMTSVNNSLDGADYLTAPLRGLLSILMVFCGVASAMYFNNDDKRRVFSAISYRKRALVMFGNNLAAVSVAGVAITISILVSGLYTSFTYETVMMILLVLAVTGFCSLLGSIFSSNTLLSAILPPVLILSIAFCPVFININTNRYLQGLLPPYYYLFGLNDISYALPMFIYTLITFAFSYFIYTKKCAAKD